MTNRAKNFDLCNILSQKSPHGTHVLYELTGGLIIYYVLVSVSP